MWSILYSKQLYKEIFGCTYMYSDLFHSWTVCKLFFFKLTLPFSQKSHECALKLTDLWMTS